LLRFRACVAALREVVNTMTIDMQHFISPLPIMGLSAINRDKT
jgi:hypothetical protein